VKHKVCPYIGLQSLKSTQNTFLQSENELSM